MAQKYNPSTGQWEEEDEENSLTGGATAAFGVGGMPSSSGTSMAPSFGDPGFFRQPQLPSGYGWGDDNYLKSQGYTKQYSSPWDTSYNYLDSSGKSLGKGYDSYQDAIRKLAFTSGVSEVQPIQSTYDAENGSWSTASPGGYTHSYYGAENQRTFTTQQELYNALLKEAGNPLGYESREKYGRKLTEGQLQNMYSQYATGALSGTVPDWTYHRAAYPGNDGTSRVTGEQALIDSDAFFGPDGILGYRTNLNPGHLNFDDTSGRVTSSTHGNTSYIPGVESIVRMLDKENGFIGVDDISKFGYKSSSMNDYNKADSTFESLVKKAAPLALAYFAMPELGALFNGAESLGGAELLGELGGYGFTSAEVAGALPELLGGGSLVEAGLGGLGLEGASGLISDLGSPELFQPGSGALEGISPEIMGPPQASEMEGLFLDDFGGGTNAMGEFTNGKGMLSPQDRIATAMRSLGMERDLAANLTQGGSKMYNFMTQSPGKAGMFKAPSPLEMLYKGGKAFMDYRSNKDAMGMYEDQLNKVRSYQDPNRARGDFANKQWQQGISDPMAGYQDFMMGGGRQFIDQARAQAAKGGKRGSYINSGKMNSDLASLYMKNQIERQNMLKGGFASSPNNEETTMKYMAPMVDMERNKYAPFGQAIDSVMRGFQLSDLFGG